MNKPTSPAKRFKQKLLERWSAEDYPGAVPRFQLGLMGRDLAIFVLLPVASVVLFKTCEIAINGEQGKPRRPSVDQKRTGVRETKSQIIDFRGPSVSKSALGIAKRSPGTLVRVRLMNVIETFGNAPVHAQIIDGGLGPQFLGGSLIGDATSDLNSGRIKIDFRFARMPNREDLAVSIAARALSLDGTLGLQGTKKEGFFARAAIRSSTGTSGSGENDSNSQDLKGVIAKALANGLLQEFSSEAQLAHNQAQVLTLQPMTDFYVELTDFFPGQAK